MSEGLLEREQISGRIRSAPRVALLVAPAGYGKTMAVERWAASEPRPQAWVSIDPLRPDRTSFWSRLLSAVRSIVPEVDDEADRAFSDEPNGTLFLTILNDNIRRSRRQVVLVIDDLHLVEDDRVLRELASVVEACGDRLGLVLLTRVVPALPLAAWRTGGWLVDIDEDQLRFTDDEAVLLGTRSERYGMTAEAARALNTAVEGWPIAFALAATTAPTSPPARTGSTLPVDGPHLLEHLVGRILDQLPAPARVGAPLLSIVDSIDSEMAHELLGPDAGEVIDTLHAWRLLVRSEHDGRPSLRFHATVRAVLQRELAWRRPAVNEDMHRRAAKVYQRRNELNEAYHHLQALGDTGAAAELVMGPALQFVDSGDGSGLARMLGELPPASRVTDPSLALDLAQLAFFAGAESLAVEWCARAEALHQGDRDAVTLKLHSTKAILALMAGELRTAAEHADVVERLAAHTRPGGPLEQRFATVGARLALVARDIPGSRAWMERVQLITEPPVMAEVAVPALRAWLEMLLGRMTSALTFAEQAMAWAADNGLRGHQSVFDAHVTAAWIGYRTGDFEQALEHARVAMEDAEVLAYDWNLIRAGVILARLRGIVEGPESGLAVIRDARAAIRHGSSTLATQLDVVHARALTQLGMYGSARSVLAGAEPTTLTTLARAAIDLAEGLHDSVVKALAEHDDWPVVDGVEAKIILASLLSGAERLDMMAAAVEAAADIGLVGPFVEHGADVEALVLNPRIAPLHPRLAVFVRRRQSTSRAAAPTVSTIVEPLTAREISIIELLPTHLSYSMMGERLFVSVNTVKSNLKAIYRKLGVTTRAEAVDVARAAGLL